MTQKLRQKHIINDGKKMHKSWVVKWPHVTPCVGRYGIVLRIMLFSSNKIIIAVYVALMWHQMIY